MHYFKIKRGQQTVQTFSNKFTLLIMFKSWDKKEFFAAFWNKLSNYVGHLSLFHPHDKIYSEKASYDRDELIRRNGERKVEDKKALNFLL